MGPLSVHLLPLDLINAENPLEVSDDVAIGAIQAGDLSSVELLFKRYARSLQMIAYRVLHDSSEAEDVVQDVFSEIPTKCLSFDQNKGSVRSWLFSVAYHSAISRRRHLASRRFYGHVELDEVEDLPAKDQKVVSVAPQVYLSLEKTELRRLFQVLSENQRRTLELYFCDGYTLDEIAAELGQSKGNVRHHYFRGLDKLRKEVFSKRPQLSAV